MPKTLTYLPRTAIFLAGIAAGALTIGSRRERAPAGVDPADLEALKNSLAQLQARVNAHEAATATRLQQVDSQLQEHETRLADVPSTSQIIAAMEQLLSKAMRSLDDRLTTQARSIEVLKTTVSQTDSLLERVLESLDSMQTGGETANAPEPSLLREPAV